MTDFSFLVNCSFKRSEGTLQSPPMRATCIQVNNGYIVTMRTGRHRTTCCHINTKASHDNWGSSSAGKHSQLMTTMGQFSGPTAQQHKQQRFGEGNLFRIQAAPPFTPLQKLQTLEIWFRATRRSWIFIEAKRRMCKMAVLLFLH